MRDQKQGYPECEGECVSHYAGGGAYQPAVGSVSGNLAPRMGI